MENRVIKFRIWDKKQKKLLLPYLAEGLRVVCMGGYLSLIHSFQNSCVKNKNDNWQNYKEENVIIQQFTGLLDFEGKEIFEGDILKDGLGEILGSVHYKSGEWIIGRNYSLVQFWDNETFKKDVCKLFVIGNFLENPDYLRE